MSSPKARPYSFLYDQVVEILSLEGDQLGQKDFKSWGQQDLESSEP